MVGKPYQWVQLVWTRLIFGTKRRTVHVVRFGYLSPSRPDLPSLHRLSSNHRHVTYLSCLITIQLGPTCSASAPTLVTVSRAPEAFGSYPFLGFLWPKIHDPLPRTTLNRPLSCISIHASYALSPRPHLHRPVFRILPHNHLSAISGHKMS